MTPEQQKRIALEIRLSKAKWLAETLDKCSGENYKKLAKEWQKEVKRLENILNQGIQLQFNFEEE